MSKKYLKFLGATLTLTMFLFVLGLVTNHSEDGPLLGENLNIEYHIC